MKTFSILLCAVFSVLFIGSQAFGISNHKVQHTPASSSSLSSSLHAEMTRSSFMAVLSAGVCSVASPSIAGAKDVDAVKGTKKDPAFEACLSQSMYECSKPKGAEQKTRAECLQECKKRCATTKAQLLKGPVE
jgi:hypothetical protein